MHGVSPFNLILTISGERPNCLSFESGGFVLGIGMLLIRFASSLLCMEWVRGMFQVLVE